MNRHSIPAARVAMIGPMPERIQRKRTRGWRRPVNSVIVDRTTRWGNPFTVAGAIEHGWASDVTKARMLAVTSFRTWFRGDEPGEQDTYWVGIRGFDRRWMRAHLSDLSGKNLCCPCPEGQPCHADVLLELANHTPEGTFVS